MACFICGNGLGSQEGSLVDGTAIGVYKIKCPFCGTFFVEDNAHEAISDSSKMKDRQQWKSRIAAYLVHKRLRGLGPIFIVGETSVIPRAISYTPTFIQHILDWFQCPISERMDRALQNLGKRSQRLGLHIVMKPNEEYPLLLAMDVTEIPFILQALHEKGYVKEYPGDRSGFTYTLTNIENVAEINILLTAKGLTHLDELERQRPRTNKAFVAMWFPDPEKEKDEQKKQDLIQAKTQLDDAYANGFYKAIKDAGYAPILVNKEEFLDKIDDKIIANIRQSRFVVADFTGQRQSVYYEAGFAHGLGVPVIFTCSKEYVDKLHFDTRQYNHIDWTDAEDLCKRLFYRIRVTIV